MTPFCVNDDDEDDVQYVMTFCKKREAELSRNPFVMDSLEFCANVIGKNIDFSILGVDTEDTNKFRVSAA